MSIEIKVISAASGKYSSRPTGTEIDTIVIHYTANGSLEDTIAWFQNPANKVSAHYVIGLDGRIVRMVPDSKRAYHAGVSSLNGRTGVNAFSIGIELVNWGPLKLRDGSYFSWPGDYTHPYEGDTPQLIAGEYWQPFPEPQLTALEQLVQLLREEYPIQWIVGHNEIAPERKRDPGPAFPWERFRPNV
ncbi:MAG: N-acetylmuramoyl-L-alanine amidase [bacterium]|nr:N-acetylmuramoyl-L-alanine amidase [bacterium]